ncbi:hypothetical protein GCM10023091_22060 [Ravibacter arvi]|uniref:Secretion system C-terminal sorting domain-containing protein n=1 Tax=Ravibacter arvi TaxID=2051041 RepID=A0ABP8LZE1_9BACT
MSFLCAWQAAEAQVTPSTFNGVVFDDANSNGVQEPGEAGIPGVLVEIRGGLTANDLHAAVISGADGSYSLSVASHPTASNYRMRYYFPTEAYLVTVPSGTSFSGGSTRTQPFSLTSGVPVNETSTLGLRSKFETKAFSTVKGLAPTNWGVESLSLPKSPTGVGIVKSVKLYINYHVVNPLVLIRNTAGAGEVTGRFTTSADFNLETPFSNEQLTHGASYNSPNIIPLGPGSELVLNNLHSTSGANEHLYEDFFSEFVGDNSFSVPFSSEGFSGFNGSGNFDASVTTQSAVGLFVVYEYEEGSLPVNLLSFSAVAEGQNAVLRWSTAAEINSLAFEVERSLNGKSWTKAGLVSARGESNAVLNYSFNDVNTVKGINYYRLKMIDRDGAFEYSPVVSLRFRSGSQPAVSVFPNPASEVLFIKNIDGSEVAELAIVNQTGGRVLTANRYDASSGVDIRNLKTGLYVIRYTLKSGEQKSLKFLVN